MSLSWNGPSSVHACALQKHFERDDLQYTLVRCLETNRCDDPGVVGLFPWFDANAPSIARLESRKTKLWTRCYQIVPD